MRILSIIVFFAAFFYACDEPVTLDLRQTPSKIVIEGLVTDAEGYQFVKISRTVGFYATGTTPRVTDAQVLVKDDLGNEYPFVHNPRSHIDSAGIYVPEFPFTGEIGRTYTLNVTVGETLYAAEDKLLPVIPVDSLNYRFSEEEAEDPKDPGKVYELLLFAREPQDEANYYLFKFYRNGALTYYDETDIYYSDDKFLAENIDGIASPVYYAIQDTGRVEAYSMSRAGYIYYGDLFSLLNNDGGGMFGSIPGSPRTNLSNGALGFFQVSAIKSKEIILKE
ncbi:MAG TPA: DUF4249 domain-containing protein [Ohtaekwangia sp.]|nr:DUF4249 domain-containing protein [Ohtaekwangia sp.]